MMADLAVPSFQSNVVEWHALACLDILERIGKRLWAGNSGRTIGVCASSDETDDLLQGRAVRDWVDRGFVDVVYWMDYADLPDFERARSARNKMVPPEALVMLCGNYSKDDDGKVHPKSADTVAHNLQESRRMLPGSGTALYLYRMLTDEQIGVLRAEVFNEPAAPSNRRIDSP